MNCRRGQLLLQKKHIIKCLNKKFSFYPSKYFCTKKSEFPIDYVKMEEKAQQARKIIGRSLTYAEKIIYGHLLLDEKEAIQNQIKQPYINLLPDRVIMQDASAQMALLQFMLANLPRTSVPTSIHCDHLIIAKNGSKEDIERAIEENKEVYEFLKTASQKYGIEFWGPGNGIIHQVALENYAIPGSLMIGTDSHTQNAGGLGMIGVGVGGTDAVDAMSGMGFELRTPKILGVKLTGKLNKWATPKDVILKLAGMLTTKGATGKIIEYFGPGINNLSCTGMATICNMGAELGATASIFPYNSAMSRYLKATNREHIAEVADKYHEILKADRSATYEGIVEINLSKVEPYINGPGSPDIAHPLSTFAKTVKENKWPEKISAALLGSCTNSSYEDMSSSSSVVKQALEKGLTSKCQFFITPGSERIRSTIERDGILKIFENFGGKVLANACGPCIGQWERTDIKPNEENSIVSSFNRNFNGRNDGNLKTKSFITSPVMLTALAISGTLTFNPMTDFLVSKDGKKFKLSSPIFEEIPKDGFEKGEISNVILPLPEEESNKIQVSIDPSSERLQLLKPFEPWNGEDFIEVPILIKVKGKCTTDAISPAGTWLKYKGHLQNISENTLTGAVNAENNQMNLTKNYYTGEENSVPNIAKQYQKMNKRWVVIADENYGEGSAREHAALQPRFLGACAIIAKSFARIHESNLKKQGILPLTFVIPEDYDKINGNDLVSITGLKTLMPNKPLKLQVHKKDTNEIVEIELQHTMNETQIKWFKAGSALNYLAQQKN
jgi:aconitate hydratase